MFNALSGYVCDKFSGAPDFVEGHFQTSDGIEFICLYFSSLTDKALVDNFIIRPILSGRSSESSNESYLIVIQSHIQHAQLRLITDYQVCIDALLNGNCLLMTVDDKRALAVDLCSFEQRNVSEPEMEATIRGPREGFVEELFRNLSLLRKKVRNDNLIFESIILGSETSTKVVLVYLKHIVDQQLIDEFRRRLQAIDADGILESSYIEEWIQDTMWTPFPQLMATERPDAIAAKLLEGKAAVITDGTPIVLTGPITFFEQFAAPEDYYQRADIATLLRWLRMISFLLSIFVPALFVSVICFHQEILPSAMLGNLAAQREGVPFTGFLEVSVMMLIFEILREAGLRMPRIAGQAISIVGALVLGQAAVEAGIVAASTVIVVSLTAISNFVAPSYSFSIAQRIVQFTFMCLAGFIGLFGLVCGIFILLIHLASLRSFGVRYLSPVAPAIPALWKDTLFRAPRPFLRRRRSSRIKD
ncbi:spore germination protein [Paenibacillus glycanilyticus]|uniref:Spore germination protein n=1 Tax=Paenibacillus glycanilyticus TaxID=126569 RepID=A0ABQ6NL61_9BACL|nr:spore germination protein [Paenibacillus glycanilyticus]GMK44759.1 spore germination protein [Paenibacillus glycanilyticus]